MKINDRRAWGLMGGAVTPSFALLSGFSETERFYTSDNQGPQANLVYFAAEAIVKPNDNQTTSNEQLIFGKTNSRTNKVGWSFTQYESRICFTIDGTFSGNDGVTDFHRFATSFGELDQLQHMMGVIYNQRIYLFKNGVMTGWGDYRGVTKSSYASTTRGIAIGAYSQPGSPSNYAPYEGGILACRVYENGLGIVSDLDDVIVEVEARYQAALANPNSYGVGCTHSWNARDAAGGVWLDEISALDCARVGTLAPVTEVISFYPRYAPLLLAEPTFKESELIANTVGDLDVVTKGDSTVIGGHVSMRRGIKDAAVASGDMTNLRFVGRSGVDEFGADMDYEGFGGTAWINMVNGTSGHATPSTNYASLGYKIIIPVGQVNALGNYTNTIQYFLDYLDAEYAANPNAMIVIPEITSALIKGSVADSVIQHFNNNLHRNVIPSYRAAGKKISTVLVYTKIDPKIDMKQLADIVGEVGVHMKASGMYKWANTIWQGLRLITGRDKDLQTINVNKMNWTFFQNTGDAQASASKSTTSNTEVIMAYAFVPANSFSVNDVIDIETTFTKALEINSPEMHMYANTALSLSGVVTIGSDTFSGTQNKREFCRQIIFKGALNSQVVNNTAQVDYPNDKTSASASVKTSLTVNFSVDQYIILAGRSPSATDTLIIEKLRVAINRMV